MQLYFASLNSGSNGNCYYVGSATEGLLIDAGISCKDVEMRLNRIGVDITTIKGIVITHEHSDHIKGVTVLANKYKLPVFISEPTFRHSSIKLTQSLVHHFRIGDHFKIGDFEVQSFSKQHDAVDPCGLVVTYHTTSVGIFTDLGCACQNLINHFQLCHAVLLEANYDDEMLDNGPYPYLLKRRIKSDHGHLSNTQAMEIIQSHRSPRLSHVFLGHLSRTNNNPEVVEKYFRGELPGLNVIVASRYREMSLVEIRSGIPQKALQYRTKLLNKPSTVQLKLFAV